MAAADQQKTFLKKKYFPKHLYAVLSFLSKRANQVYVGEIKERFKNEISNPVINGILMGLELKNFIIKEDMKDRRKKAVVLTDEGQDLVKTLAELSRLMSS